MIEWSLKHQFHGSRVRRNQHNGSLCREKKRRHREVLVYSKLTVNHYCDWVSGSSRATGRERGARAGRGKGVRTEGSNAAVTGTMWLYIWRILVPVSVQSFKKEIDKPKLFGGQGSECWSFWTPGYLRNKILDLSEKTRQNLRSLSKYSWIAIVY